VERERDWKGRQFRPKEKSPFSKGTPSLLFRYLQGGGLWPILAWGVYYDKAMVRKEKGEKLKRRLARAGRGGAASRERCLRFDARRVLCTYGRASFEQRA